MSYDVADKCGREFINDGKEHRCVLDSGHKGMCLCDCGEKSPKTHTPLKLTPYYKRQKKQ